MSTGYLVLYYRNSLIESFIRNFLMIKYISLNNAIGANKLTSKIKYYHRNYFCFINKEKNSIRCIIKLNKITNYQIDLKIKTQQELLLDEIKNSEIFKAQNAIIENFFNLDENSDLIYLNNKINLLIKESNNVYEFNCILLEDSIDIATFEKVKNYMKDKENTHTSEIQNNLKNNPFISNILNYQAFINKNFEENEDRNFEKKIGIGGWLNFEKNDKLFFDMKYDKYFLYDKLLMDKKDKKKLFDKSKIKNYLELTNKYKSILDISDTVFKKPFSELDNIQEDIILNDNLSYKNETITEDKELNNNGSNNADDKNITTTNEDNNIKQESEFDSYKREENNNFHNYYNSNHNMNMQKRSSSNFNNSNNNFSNIKDEQRYNERYKKYDRYNKNDRRDSYNNYYNSNFKRNTLNNSFSNDNSNNDYNDNYSNNNNYNYNRTDYNNYKYFNQNNESNGFKYNNRNSKYREQHQFRNQYNNNNYINRRNERYNNNNMKSYSNNNNNYNYSYHSSKNNSFNSERTSNYSRSRDKSPNQSPNQYSRYNKIDSPRDKSYDNRYNERKERNNLNNNNNYYGDNNNINYYYNINNYYRQGNNNKRNEGNYYQKGGNFQRNKNGHYNNYYNNNNEKQFYKDRRRDDQDEEY